MQSSYRPDKERCSDQHQCEVDSHCCLKIEGFEVCCGVGDQEEEDGGEVGGQELVHDASLEHNLHLETIRDEVRIKIFKSPTLSILHKYDMVSKKKLYFSQRLNQKR